VVVAVELLPGLGLLHHALDDPGAECLATAHSRFFQRDVDGPSIGDRRGAVHIGVAAPSEFAALLDIGVRQRVSGHVWNLRRDLRALIFELLAEAVVSSVERGESVRKPGWS
jgi:hypothetical protein